MEQIDYTELAEYENKIHFIKTLCKTHEILDRTSIITQIIL